MSDLISRQDAKDEVEHECDGIVRFVVTGFCGEMEFGFKHQCDYDDVGEYRDIEDLRKIGRHFDEVEEDEGGRMKIIIKPDGTGILILDDQEDNKN